MFKIGKAKKKNGYDSYPATAVEAITWLREKKPLEKVLDDLISPPPAPTPGGSAILHTGDLSLAIDPDGSGNHKHLYPTIAALATAMGCSEEDLRAAIDGYPLGVEQTGEDEYVEGATWTFFIPMTSKEYWVNSDTGNPAWIIRFGDRSGNYDGVYFGDNGSGNGIEIGDFGS